MSSGLVVLTLKTKMSAPIANAPRLRDTIRSWILNVETLWGKHSAELFILARNLLIMWQIASC